MTDVMDARPKMAVARPIVEEHVGDTRPLVKRRRGGRVAPVCDDTPWCGLTLYEHQAPHLEAIIVEMIEIEEQRRTVHGVTSTTPIQIRRRIELCSWPCVENLAASRMHERAEDTDQNARRHASLRAAGIAESKIS